MSGQMTDWPLFHNICLLKKKNARTHARTRARARAHTHTHTHTHKSDVSLKSKYTLNKHNKNDKNYNTRQSRYGSQHIQVAEIMCTSDYVNASK
jgi:hypothetical protein